MISNSDILGPDVKLPFSGSNETRENVTRVNSNSHIDVNMVLVSAKKGGDKKLAHYSSALMPIKVNYSGSLVSSMHSGKLCVKNSIF